MFAESGHHFKLGDGIHTRNSELFDNEVEAARRSSGAHNQAVYVSDIPSAVVHPLQRHLSSRYKTQ